MGQRHWKGELGSVHAAVLILAQVEPCLPHLTSCFIPQWFTPVSCHCLLGYEFQRVGQLRYKCMLNPERWQRAFFILQKAHLFICPAEEDGAEDSINLRRLQELSECPG